MVALCRSSSAIYRSKTRGFCVDKHGGWQWCKQLELSLFYRKKRRLNIWTRAVGRNLRVSLSQFVLYFTNVYMYNIHAIFDLTWKEQQPIFKEQAKQINICFLRSLTCDLAKSTFYLCKNVVDDMSGHMASRWTKTYFQLSHKHQFQFNHSYSPTPAIRTSRYTGSGWHGFQITYETPKKKLNVQINVAGNNGGSWMYIYLQCEFYTKTFYKPSACVFYAYK